MTKVLLNYDTATGNVTADDGSYIGCWHGITPYTEPPQFQQPMLPPVTVTGLDKNPVDNILKLKAAGYNFTQIKEMKELKLI